MDADKHIFSAIPTNIITGFLGAGKSSAILHLLKHKPKNERWAVLVNEFGEIGIDGSLLEGQYTQEQGVFIREVPGGCMCCAAGLPMQVALNQLLTYAKPDRLLIEPTGLGHPKEVLQTLSADAYASVLALHTIVTLVDARKLSDRRYTEHETFNEQIAIADVVVGNKQDLYQGDEKAQLATYVKQYGSEKATVVFSQHGDLHSLNLSNKTTATAEHHHHHHHHAAESKPLLSDEPIPECGYLKAINQGEGFYSIGWRFSPEQRFDGEKLSIFLNSINAERMKAVFITNKGMLSYNLTAESLTENTLSHCEESRIEIIHSHIDEQWEAQLMACLAPFISSTSVSSIR
ncbi:CobW family GTP-binding protein [Eionea flava]